MRTLSDRYKAVVFDLDDTLTSESEYQESANAAVLSHLAMISGKSLSEITPRAAEAAKCPRTEYFQTLLPSLGISATSERVASLIKVHREHPPSIAWYPDVEHTLEMLKAAGALLGIVTDGHAVAQRRKIAALHASEYFDEIIVTDELGREYWKPHERAFIEIAKKLGVSPKEMIYVGDNPEKDFFISERLPVTTVRVARDGQLKSRLQYLEEIREDHRIDSLTDVLRLFNEPIEESQKCQLRP